MGFLIYRQQRLKNRQQLQQHELLTAIDKIETQNKLQQQRLTISRDLHDNIGSQLTFVISSIDNLRYVFKIQDPILEDKLIAIGNFTRETIIELRDTIWAMNHSEISLDDLRGRICNFIEKAKKARGDINFDFIADENLQKFSFSAVSGMNVYRSIQEALNNAIKYSGAKNISVKIVNCINEVKIMVNDDGFGFDLKTVNQGNGLRNIESRINSIGGSSSVETSKGNGSKITMIVSSQSIV